MPLKKLAVLGGKPVGKVNYPKWPRGLLFYHSILLTDRVGCDNIIGALKKLRGNTAELVEFARM